MSQNASIRELHEREGKIARPFEGISRERQIQMVHRFLAISELHFHYTAIQGLMLRAVVLAAQSEDGGQHFYSGSRQENGDSDLGRPYEYYHGDLSNLPQDRLITSEGTVLVNKGEKEALDAEDSELTMGNILDLTIFRAYRPMVFWLIACCSMGAVVQGWDETAVNDAQIFYSQLWNIDYPHPLYGLVNSAPYLMAGIACLFNHWFNSFLGGRRPVIFWACVFSSASCLSQAFSPSWPVLFFLRLILGLGIGPKSATVPLYAAECAPAKLRGALVMMWQMWTACGLMLGFASGLVFWSVEDTNWRWMLGSPCVFPILVLFFIFNLPESPRFLLRRASEEKDEQKKRQLIKEAYESLKSLNKTELQACRELITIWYSLQAELDKPDGSRFSKIITDPRSRNSLVASCVLMFLREFCGVNVLANYSTKVLQDDLKYSPDDRRLALFSLGIGVANFVCAVPALFLIDTLGRRPLLLFTFPLLALFQFLVGGLAPSRNAGGIISAMYLFIAFYSIGEGPVPYVYAAESMPVYHRDFGMGIVTFVDQILYFVLAVSWPRFDAVFGDIGSFAWYGSWCVVGEILVFIFIRETKGKSLEGMAKVFAAPVWEHMKFATQALLWCLKCCGSSTKFRPFSVYVADWESKEARKEESEETSQIRMTEL